MVEDIWPFSLKDQRLLKMVLFLYINKNVFKYAMMYIDVNQHVYANIY